MNVYKFVKENGLEKAKKVIDDAPEFSVTHFGYEDDECSYYQWTNNVIFWDSDCGRWDEVYFDLPSLISIEDLKQAIKDFELVDYCGGIDKAKTIEFIKRSMGLIPHANRLKNAIERIEQGLKDET